ncbi:MAG: ArsR family transcriptional regulator, partial [Candidatus Korarchaeota archaeon]|nr:ArsR family transcriptional regulator [Candidatus Korarchaeota archaeon]NIU82649.1 ArsR family transcriptional regulator [Candidatus Thorarchaeota archaeon]NIW13130.1 ArsR family transcriptional regulator [Candidatus Thorarchaeota archaeon]NIW51289.1 ArsR family transcriptional regulator [Candidatus Korarchaeota archaeon]
QDLNAIELKDKLGINESAVRRHLNILEKRGFVRHYFKKAGRGRPKKKYTLTPEGRQLFPRQIGLLTTILIQKLKKRYNEEELEALMADVAKELEEFFPPPEGKGVEERLETLVNAFNEFGFFSSYSKENNFYFLECQNCVFGRAAKEIGSLLCNVHKKIIQNSVGTENIEQVESLLKGDKVCKYRITP